MCSSRAATTPAAACRRRRWLRNLAAWCKSCRSCRSAPRPASLNAFGTLPRRPGTKDSCRGSSMFHPDVWSCAEKILCVRLDALGDLLMTVPAIRALKESYPGRHITLLTSSAGAAVAPLIPEIDDVIVYEAPWMKASPERQ